MKKILFLCFLVFTFTSCDVLTQVTKTASQYLTPTPEEMTSALKEALNNGAGNAATFLNQAGGYLNNPRFKIPFPQEAIRAADYARKFGLGSQVDKFIETLNKGAEDAAIEAKPIFIEAVRSMSITDAKNILLGANTAATDYFKSKTYSNLVTAFAPHIKSSLDKFAVTKYWNDITTVYNKVPGVQKVNTDLTKYAIEKALDGLFLKVADEEGLIRSNVNNRISPLLKKVFGWVDTQKG